MVVSCDWLQTLLPLWCCQAVALALEPHPQRVCRRITWQPSSPWASVETRQPKHFAPRLESHSLDFLGLSTGKRRHRLNWPCFSKAFRFQFYSVAECSIHLNSTGWVAALWLGNPELNPQPSHSLNATSRQHKLQCLHPVWINAEGCHKEHPSIINYANQTCRSILNAPFWPHMKGK